MSCQKKKNLTSYLSWYVKMLNTLSRAKLEHLKELETTNPGFTKLIFKIIQDAALLNIQHYHIYPTPPLGQDMTQGQF